MPLHPHPDHAISFTEPDNDVAWMSLVLSQSEPGVPLLPPARSCRGDRLAQAIEAELPSQSFRLQILHAWMTARGGCPAEVAGHA